MAEVEVTPTALEELTNVPLPIQLRIRNVFERLADWPAVSGSKPLRRRLAGNFRIRTGDYRVVFRVRGEIVTMDLKGSIEIAVGAARPAGLIRLVPHNLILLWILLHRLSTSR